MTSLVASAGVSQHDQQQPVYSGSEETFRVVRNSTKGKAAATTAAVLCAKETQSASQRRVTAHLLSDIYFVYPIHFLLLVLSWKVRVFHDFDLILLPSIPDTQKCICSNLQPF